MPTASTRSLTTIDTASPDKRSNATWPCRSTRTGRRRPRNGKPSVGASDCINSWMDVYCATVNPLRYVLAHLVLTHSPVVSSLMPLPIPRRCARHTSRRRCCERSTKRRRSPWTFLSEYAARRLCARRPDGDQRTATPCRRITRAILALSLNVALKPTDRAVAEAAGGLGVAAWPPLR